MRRLVLLLVLGALVACGHADPKTPPVDLDALVSAYRNVCAGTGTPLAPDYAHHKDHRAVVVEGERGEMRISRGRLPEDWTISFPFAEDAEDVDVVVCGERVAAKPVRLCDDVSGDKDAIKWHSATYAYTARSARTGKALGKAKTIESTDRSCPTNVDVAKGHAPVDQFALASETDVKDFVEPYLD
ncbi:MAG: hypothetical protein ACJ71Z_03965 [Aeromicrobium sp.]